MGLIFHNIIEQLHEKNDTSTNNRSVYQRSDTSQSLPLQHSEFIGILFNNPLYDCYINASINGMFSSSKFRDIIMASDESNEIVEKLKEVFKSKGPHSLQSLKVVDTTFKDETIKMASAQLVSSHASKFPDEKILKQRHQVRVVPVTKVNYEWKGRSRSFYVYGYENKVYLPNNNYPQSYCWGCCIV